MKWGWGEGARGGRCDALAAAGPDVHLEEALSRYACGWGSDSVGVLCAQAQLPHHASATRAVTEEVCYNLPVSREQAACRLYQTWRHAAGRTPTVRLNNHAGGVAGHVRTLACTRVSGPSRVRE